MPITNLNDAIAKTVATYDFFRNGVTNAGPGILNTPIYTTGRPAAATANGEAIAGAALSSTTAVPIAGSIPIIQPSVPGERIYITRYNICANLAAGSFLADRLWHNDNISETTTTGQTVNSVAWPDRDLLDSSCGSGVIVGIEVSTATTNVSAITNTTLTYTNDRGVGSRTATISSFPPTAQAGTFVRFELQSGDTGVQSIQTLTLGTSYGGGAIHLVAFRPITHIFMQSNTQIGVGDIISGGFPSVPSGAVLYPIQIPISTAGLILSGSLSYAIG